MHTNLAGCTHLHIKELHRGAGAFATLERRNWRSHGERGNEGFSPSSTVYLLLSTVYFFPRYFSIDHFRRPQQGRRLVVVQFDKRLLRFVE
jgi:hypothetical protein